MQEGRVTFYDSKSGEGKLVLNSDEEFEFSADKWKDDVAKPETGTMVECNIIDGLLKSFKSLQLGMPAADSDSEGSEESSDEDSPTYSVTQTLNNYFSSVKSTIGEPGDLQSKAKLDYFLSKRFLITSYNNLKSLDPSLHDHRDIKEKLNTLRELHKAYYRVTERADVPQLAFEIIFLRSQPEYTKYLKDKEDMTNRISTLNIFINSIEPEIKQGEAELKKMSKGDRSREALEDRLKPMRGNYVDSIHEKLELEKALANMKDIKALYTEKYFDFFVTELADLSEEYQKVLAEILNYKASELDYTIWEHASRSKLIREYFDDAGIEGDYSTKTFLKYYLGTLDKKQLGDEQVELFKFMDYLNKHQK